METDKGERPYMASFYLVSNTSVGRSQYLYRLRRVPAAAGLLGWPVQFLQRAWISLYIQCGVLSSRVLCFG
jgi:hypothetical protein